MASAALRRAGLGLAGFVIGLVVLALAGWIYLRSAQVEQIRETVGAEIGLPAELLELEEVDAAGRVRFTMREVALIGADGDTLAAAPRLTAWLDTRSLAGDGPIVFSEAELFDPFVRLVQTPEGEWTIFEVFRVEAGGEEVALAGEDEGRPVVFRDVRVHDGRVVVALPAEAAPPADTAQARFALELPLTRLRGEWYRVFTFADLDARLPAVRVLGDQGWRVEVAALDARLVEPELRITRLEGSFEALGEDGVRLDVDVLRFGESVLAGAGTIRFTEPEPTYDVRLSIVSLAFADLQQLMPALPAEGRLETQLAIRTPEPGRIALDADELLLTLRDSRLSGEVTAVLGGEAAPEFRDTRLAVDLELSLLEELGLVERVPFTGRVTGTVATRTPVEGLAAGALDLDLRASLVPRGRPELEPSVVGLEGAVALGTAEQPLRMQGLQLSFGPLRLESLAALLPEQQERLRGELRGTITLSGTPTDLSIEGGELAYDVGAAQPTRLVGLAGSIATEPELRFDLRARAEPLALATLREQFPGLPFRTATLAGPLRVSGTTERIRFNADLQGDAGAIRFSGLAEPNAPEGPLRFDVEGRVEAFTASRVIARELPIEGAVTGTFAAQGTTQDLTFNVDLAQTAGRFALEGRLQQGEVGAPPQFEVAGQVQNFRLGVLLGQPGLFPEPLSGEVDVQGGGAEPYRFDVDLRGETAVFDLAGLVDLDGVPRYDVSGRVTGLDLRRLPIELPLPRTQLDATLDVDLRGGTLATLAGTLRLDAAGSRVGGVEVRSALVDVGFDEGVVLVDTINVVLRETRLSAEGMLGLTRPAPEPLRYALQAPDLSRLAQLLAPPGIIEPRVEGSLQMRGVVGGSLDDPALALALRGRRLRYESWRAATLSLDVEAAETAAAGWGGTVELAADDVALPTGDRFEAVRLEADGSEQTLAVGVSLRRDASADLALRGVVDFVGREPRGFELESLALQAEDARWTLADEARVRWGGVEGLRVDGLRLERTGGETGLIAIDGQLPPTGDAAFSVLARGVELADLRRIVGNAPDVGGVLSLEATLEGAMGDPSLAIDGRIDAFRYEDAELDSLAVSARYDQQLLSTEAALWAAGTRLAVADIGIPMSLSLEGLIPSFELRRDGPLAGRIVADSVPLDLVAALAPPLAEGAGVARADVRIGGTLDQPRLEGQARVFNGALSVVPLGERFDQITAALRLEQNRIRIDTLQARSGGYASAGGTIAFVPGEGPRLDLQATLENFELMSREDVAAVQASGQLSLTGQIPAPTLTGQFVVDEANIAIPELDERTGVEITDAEIGQIGADTLTAGGPLPAFLSGLQIGGLELRLGESVWLVSDDARIQIAGALQVYRRGTNLQLFGTLNTERGTYALEVGPITREFDVVRGRVQFTGSPDLNPTLDILAASEVRTQGGATGPSLTVLVNITGTVEFPRIRFLSESRTPLPESELLSYLIFGRPTFELGGATQQFAQNLLFQETIGGLLATSLEQPFLDIGLCDYVRARTQVGSLLGSGLGDLQSSLGATLGATGFECGKQLVGNVFLTAEWGLGFVSGADNIYALSLDWRIDPEWLLDLSYAPVRRDPLLRVLNPDLEYQASINLRRRWTYGEPGREFELDTEEPPAEVRVPSLAEQQMRR